MMKAGKWYSLAAKEHPLRRHVIFCLATLIPACPVAAPSPAEDPLKLERELDAQFLEATSDGAPGLAVLVKKDGKVLVEKGYGVRELRQKERISADTDFRLASCTKQFTAMAAMLLVADGKLGYEETLKQVFPEFPAYGQAISVRNLLNHTSGLPDYEDLMDQAEKRGGTAWSPERQIRDDEVLALLEQEARGKFAPGSRWEYSNSGYVVLGLIVAKRSGKPFGEFLRERIFAPLKMEGTLVFEKGKNQVPRRAYGHSKIDNRFVETDQSSTSATEGDGGVYSNLEDLSKWDDALRSHTLLGEKEFLPALLPAALPPGAEARLAEDAPPSMRGKPIAYGFGWFLDLEERHPLAWHYGDTMGFKTAIVRCLREKVSVIVLSNRTDMDPQSVAMRIAREVR
jgi:CubicO group peptidase (beta-lactamase class C family)